MKKAIFIFITMLTLVSFGQNATWTGTKTAGTTLKFNFPANNANTRFLTLDASGKPATTTLSGTIFTENTPTEYATPYDLVIGQISPFQFKKIDSRGFVVRNICNPNCSSFNETTLSDNYLKFYSTSIMGGPQEMVVFNKFGFFFGTAATAPNGTQSTTLGNDVSVLFPVKPNGSYILSTTSDDNNLPVYADNSAAIAGGLAVNKKYRTATGQLMIVY